MSTVWMFVIRMAFNAIIAAVGKIPAEQWAKIGGLVVSFLQKMQDKLPAGNPLITTLNAYKAPYSLLAQPKPDDDSWAN